MTIETKTPGIKAIHAEITPSCRSGRGAGGAFEEAARRARLTYDSVVDLEANADATFHLVLTVARDRGDRG